MFYDADGIERDPELSQKFWDTILEQDIHWLFMMNLLGEKMNGQVSVKEIFDWNSPEYELDFPDPPEISW